MSRFFFLASLFFYLNLELFAQTPTSPNLAAPISVSPSILADDPSEYLGLDLSSIFSRFGAPSRVNSLRGTEAWQDDVVFDYGSGWIISWAGDRVWKIAFKAAYSGSVYGLFLGDLPEKAYSILGTPWFGSEESLVYRMPWRGYPVRLRIMLEGGRISGFELYRADL